MKVSIFFKVLIGIPKATYKILFFLAYLAWIPIIGVTTWEDRPDVREQSLPEWSKRNKNSPVQ